MAIPINQGSGVQELCKFARIVTQMAALSAIRIGSLRKQRTSKDWGSILLGEFGRREFFFLVCRFLDTAFRFFRSMAA